MINVNGIILIVCCQKYKDIRQKYKLPKNTYSNWEVVYLFGNENQEQEYKYENNTLTIKCEDSYLFLMKKLILGMKYLYNIFNIKDGILRCGDDLIFKDNLLIDFLNSNKDDYMGKNFIKKSIISNEINLNNTIHNTFMINYYERNQNEKIIINKQIKTYNDNLNISKLNTVINISDFIALGHIYYVSNKSVNLLINNFDSIFKTENNSYPYILEDLGVGYILFKNNINLTLKQDLWYNPHYQNFDSPGEYICFHTNEGNN